MLRDGFRTPTQSSILNSKSILNPISDKAIERCDERMDQQKVGKEQTNSKTNWRQELRLLYWYYHCWD